MHSIGHSAHRGSSTCCFWCWTSMPSTLSSCWPCALKAPEDACGFPNRPGLGKLHPGMLFWSCRGSFLYDIILGYPWKMNFWASWKAGSSMLSMFKCQEYWRYWSCILWQLNVAIGQLSILDRRPWMVVVHLDVLNLKGSKWWINPYPLVN